MKKFKFIPLAVSLLALASCGGEPAPATTPGGASGDVSASKSKTSKTSKQKQKFNVTFDLNYQGAPEAQVVEVEPDSQVAAPAAPTRDGYVFEGWKVAADSNEMYDFAQYVKGNMTLYASWGTEAQPSAKKYYFEAEFCPCITDGDGMTGSTWSGGSFGKGLIQEDYDDNDDGKGDLGAHGNYFVHHNYVFGNTLVFDIMSDKAVSNASISWRLSLEYRLEMVMNPEKYPIKLNGNSISYTEFTLTKEQDPLFAPFQDYLVNAHVNLVEGLNKFELVTNNTEKMEGTALSQAPCVDAIIIETAGVNLSWPTAKPSNIQKGGE